eukprot:6245795-Ditylum_brightwellii.AAC.1
MSIIKGNITVLVVEQESDCYDQWVLTKFAARNGKFITVITAYKPCKVTKKQGVTTYHQQVVLLKQDSQDICPWRAFILDLIKLLRSRQEDGKLIVLEGNFNDVLSTKSTLILKCPERRNKSSSLSGKHIIDCMFVSPELKPAICQKGCNRFDQVTHTDHHGMFIDFDTDELFGNEN